MDQDSQPSKADQPLFLHGNPNPERVGFFCVGVFDARTADFSEVIAKIADVLGRPARYVASDGYEHDIVAGAIQADTGRMAWVACKSKELEKYVDVEFRLKAQVDGRVVIDWVVETYNPYFGCRVGYMAWHDERVVIIYREKHCTYACSLPLSGEITRVKIDDDWMVTADQVVFPNEPMNAIERLSLPQLTTLDAVSVANARSEELLSPGFDERAARRKAAIKRRKRWWQLW